MAKSQNHESVASTLDRINRTWREGRIDEMSSFLHSDVVMAYPSFAGRLQGREEFVATFRGFLAEASVREFSETDRQVDVAGNTAVATSRFEMVYERSGKRYRSTGRDFWVLQREEEKWLAVWRTMFDIEESEVS